MAAFLPSNTWTWNTLNQMAHSCFSMNQLYPKDSTASSTGTHLLTCWSHSSLSMAKCVQCAHKHTCVQLFPHLSTTVNPAWPAALPEHIRHRVNYLSEQNATTF